MNEHKENVQVGIAPTPESEFYVAWGKENLKGEMKGIGESLKQLLALSTALAGSTIIFNTDAIFFHSKFLPFCLS